MAQSRIPARSPETITSPNGVKVPAMSTLIIE
jgi:hypothetical protein